MIASPLHAFYRYSPEFFQTAWKQNSAWVCEELLAEIARLTEMHLSYVDLIVLQNTPELWMDGTGSVSIHLLDRVGRRHFTGRD